MPRSEPTIAPLARDTRTWPPRIINILVVILRTDRSGPTIDLHRLISAGFLSGGINVEVALAEQPHRHLLDG